MATIWDMKRKCQELGEQRPSNRFLGTLQTYIRETARKRWTRRDRSDAHREFDEIANAIIKFIGVKDVVLVLHETNFLIRKEDSVLVFLGKDSSCLYSKEYVDASGLEISEDGNVYATTCYRTYKTFDETSKTLKYTKALYWKIGPTASCARCGSTVLKSELVYSEMSEQWIDKACDHRLKSWVNPLPNLAEPITGYHSHRSGWLFLIQRKKNEKSIPMGIEIEIHSSIANDHSGAIKSAQHILMNHPDNNYYFEWDGSLRDGGFEMITNPMTLEYHQGWWESILRTMRTACVGYNVEKQYIKNMTNQQPLSVSQEQQADNESVDYGIHITVSRKYISDAVVTKLCKFFDDSKNKEFLWCIAQRSKMYGGYTLGSKAKPKARDTLIIAEKKVSGGADRRQPVNLKGHSFIEFRMFRSTLNQVSFIKNLEFIDAIISYLSSAPGVKVDHRTFILWLTKAQNSKRYPNLVLYLQHPLFFVKGAGKVKNNWSDLFTNYKLVVSDPLKEYGPKPVFVDNNDVVERSMI